MSKQPSATTHSASIETIESELLTLVHAETQRWQRTAILMIEVEQGRLWNLKHDTSITSFTKWIKSLAQAAGVHESNFWRCLKAGRFYIKLAEASENENDESSAIPKLILPDLEHAEISPESLELVEKITTAAPFQKAREIVKKAINGELSRQDLRTTWQTYRPAKKGQTLRGRGQQQQTVDPEKQTACDLISTLTNDDELQTVRNSICRGKNYRLFREVAVETGTSRHKRRIDAVLVADDRELKYIGIEIKVSEHDLINDKKFTEYSSFVHALYLAVTPELVEAAKSLAIESIGILSIESSAVTIVRVAGESNSKKLVHDTAQTIIRHLVFK